MEIRRELFDVMLFIISMDVNLLKGKGHATKILFLKGGLWQRKKDHWKRWNLVV